MPTYQGKMSLPDISATMHIWWYCSGVTMAPASGEENKTRKCLGQFHTTYYQIWQPFFPLLPSAIRQNQRGSQSQKVLLTIKNALPYYFQIIFTLNMKIHRYIEGYRKTSHTSQHYTSL